MIESNPLAQKLEGYQLILGSGSPRRRMYLKALGLPFIVQKKEVDEIYPNHLQGEKIAEYLAELKAGPFKNQLVDKDILITADTVVWHKKTSLAKANGPKEALEMLQRLSGDWHQVITAVCFTTKHAQQTISETTQVKFMDFSEAELNHYIQADKPYDKAGAYGIQEWLGNIGISEIKGSYTNVVGLPTHLVYKTLMDMVS